MTIVLTGGGSGGHITPILAVASELKKLRPDVKLVYIGQTGDSLLDIPAKHPAIDEVYSVRAGKFRRYHGAGVKQLFDVVTQAQNIRDALRVAIGLWQSYRLMKRLKPQIVFSRGGFVSVPVCLGAKLNHIPYVTHDSDSLPSLANRIIARWAILHAVALPKEIYPYPQKKTVTVGVPVGKEFELVTSKLQQRYKQDLGLDQYLQVLLITGGGNGAEQLNRVVAAAVPALLKRFPKLAVVHQAGRALESALNGVYDDLLAGADRQRVIVLGFVNDLYRYSGAADVIIARGGASTLAEYAIQGKACIIVPATHLVGGHQIKNAKVYADKQAIEVVTMDESETDGLLAHKVSLLLSDDEKRAQLGKHLAGFALPDAAHQLAVILLEQITAQKQPV